MTSERLALLTGGAFALFFLLWAVVPEANTLTVPVAVASILAALASDA